MQNDMEHFSSSVRFREVALRTAADIVQHSFVVQKSISPLNLEMCQSYIISDEQTNSNLPSFSYSRDFINSEEKCRKVHANNRNVLYTLHLDLPKDKERSLKSDWMSTNDNNHCKEREFHIAKIFIEDSFYTNVLSHHVDYACSRTDQELKLLKWFMKSDVFVKPDIQSLPTNIMNRIVDCFHPVVYEPEFVKDCFRKLRYFIIEFLITSEPFKHQKRIKFFYQCYRTGKCEETMIWLECSDTPKVGDLNRYVIDGGIEDKRSIEAVPYHLHLRRYLLLQLLTFYIEKFRDSVLAFEFLRVCWNTITYPFLSSSEIVTALETKFDSETIADICNFYSEVVGELRPYVEPRTLQHYCRIEIRQELYRQRRWVPDGIEELNLPKKIRSYLNLEE